MSQLLVFLLLALALVLPVLGAAALRLLAPRLDARQFFGTAALLFSIAIISVLVLSRSNIESLRIGNLTLLLPLSARSPDELPPELQDLIDQADQITDTVQPDLEPGPLLTPTLAATALPSATVTPTVELPPTATIAPTATVTPTVELPPTATPEPPPLEPTAVPPTEPPAPPPPPEPRTYTVQPGDTLRGIAEQFNVSVADLLRVNNLTAEEADALRVGTVLTIP